MIRRLAPLSIVAVALSIALAARADEPPSFLPFEARSANGRFVAAVARDGERWTLAVHEVGEAGARTERWRCEYRYTGYAGALVSDDGRTVVYVEVWYGDDHPAIEIYREGKKVASIPGRDVPFDRAKMRTTASHRLWLLDGGALYGRSAAFDAAGRLVVRTGDGRRHVFDPATGERMRD